MLNEARLLGLIDACMTQGRVISDSSSFDFGLQSRDNPIQDAIAIPMSLWSQLVMEIRPGELIRKPEESA